MTCRLLIVRHGQTSWNNDRRFQGIADIPLNDAGMRQAQLLAQRLSSCPPDIINNVIYTSPLIRAKSTAIAISASFNITPIIVPDLIEINFGIWEGQSLTALERDNPEAFNHWRSDPFYNVPDGAEAWPQISHRLTRAMNMILSSSHQRIILVTHGGVIRALLALIMSIDPHKAWNVEVSNCSITGIIFRDGYSSLFFANDDIHIRGGENGVNMPIWGESYGD